MTDDHEDYHYEEDAEGHENQLEFDRDYTTHEVLQDKGLIGKAQEDRVRRNLMQDEPETEGTTDGPTTDNNDT